MLTTKQKKNLKKLLAMAKEPDITFTYNELLGYMFGLAMTPDVIVPSEWMPMIFGGDLPEFESMDQMQKMTTSLMDLYNTSIADFQSHRLSFPFNIDNMQIGQIEELYEWVSGFEEALALRDELWDPEEFPKLSEPNKAALYHSMMTIQGLVDPVEAVEYFEEMPDELFEEAFTGMDPNEADREAQIQVFLMATLPLAIETFQEHAYALEKKRQQQLGQAPPFPSRLRSVKIGRNDPCPCNSGKKYKKCCGSNVVKTGFGSEDISGKKSNVIKVDFPQHGKKKQVEAPVYQLKVGLQGAKPPIWRRVQVPGNYTLEDLHKVIQIAMGWTDSHLHQFMIDRTCYNLPSEEDLYRTSRPKNESKYTLQDLEKKIQPTFQYIYDFGDDWIHQISVEKILPAGEGPSIPTVVTGRRACPPEDVGGIYGFMHMLEIVNDPEDEEYEEMTEWLGTDFDPAEFGKEEVKEINAILEEVFGRKKR